MKITSTSAFVLVNKKGTKYYIDSSQNKEFHTKDGLFNIKEVIGQEFGSKIISNTSKEFFVVPTTFSDKIAKIRRGPQVIHEKDAAQKLQWFKEETNKVFNKDFKGFEFVINDKKISYLPGSVEDVKSSQSSIDNFIQRYVDNRGLVKDTAQYHRALSMAMNPDKYAKFFYEQGKADAVDNISKKTKNINMDVRSTPQVTSKSGFKVRSLNQDSGRGLKIRSIKKSN